MARTIDWARAQSVLERVLDLPSEEREHALIRVCDDPELRQRLSSLLRAADLRGELFEPAASAQTESVDAQARAIGPWRLVRALGAGGMGDVWLVERDGADFRQRAALKLVKRGMDTEAVLARFRRERKVLAELTHPAIPSLIDGGASDDGRPYVVMEYVDGEPLDQFVRTHSLDIGARLRLFLAICDAVQHAHERGVVHRDLKPSNVLVTSAGEPKLLDFGISKVLDAREDSQTIDLTQTGQHMLTPRYASPEQVLGREVTAAADVYALGLMLWELLVGRPAVSLDGLSQSEWIDTICERDVPRPSTSLDANATSHKRAITGDLDTICAMALRKEPARRYASVKQLADDVRRHLDAQPVLARADTVTYRVSKFVRRNRLLVGATFGIMLALAAGLAIAVVMFLRSEDARRLAQERLDDAEHFAYQSAIRGAYSELVAGNPLPDIQAQPAHLRGWEWKHLVARNDCTKRVVWRTPGPTAIAIGAGGGVLAVCEPSEVVLLDLERDCELQRIPTEFPPAYMALSPKGDRLAAVRDGALRMYDVASGEILATLHSPTKFCHVSFTPDGAELLGGHMNGELRRYSTECPERWERLAKLGDMCRSTQFSSDGQWLAVGGGRSEVLVLRWSDKRVVQRFQHPDDPQYVRGVTFLGGDAYLASVDNNGRSAVWELATGKALPLAPDNAQHCMGIGTRPDADELVLIGNHMRIWSLSTGESRTLSGVHLPMRRLVIHPTRPLAYTACDDGRVHEWDLSTEPVPVLATREDVTTMAASPDGRSIVAINNRGDLVRVYAVDDDEVRARRRFSSPLIRATGFAPDGHSIYVADTERVHRLSSASLETLGAVELDSSAGIAASPTLSALLVATADGDVVIVDGNRLEVTGRHKSPLEAVSALSSNSEYSTVALAARDAPAIAVSNAGMESWRTIELPHSRRAKCLAVSHNGRWVAVGDDFVSVYSVDDGSLLFDRPGETTPTLSFTRSDDRLLAPAGRHLLVVHTGRWSVLATFKDNIRGVKAMLYCPASESVFTSDVACDIRHYRAVDAPRIDSPESL